jgi:hypothetical protein
VEEYSYTSTHPLGHTGPVTGLLYFYRTELLSHASQWNIADQIHVKALSVLTADDEFKEPH